MDKQLREIQKKGMDQLEMVARQEGASLNQFDVWSEGFDKDPRLTLTTVAFPPSELAAAIETHVIAPLRKADPRQYYYAAHSLHVTIQNVRRISYPPNFSAEDVRKIAEVISSTSRGAAEGTAQIDGLLKLPSSIALRVYLDQTTCNLIFSLRNDLAAAGYPDDKKYIHPFIVFGNITVARFLETPNEAFQQLINELAFASTMRINKLSLISTNAVCHPEHTTALGEFPLQQATHAG